MFDKRLLVMVPEAKRFIIASVALQWLGLLANIALFFVIGAFLQGVLAGQANQQSMLQLAAAGTVAITLRAASQTYAQTMGHKAAAAAKLKVRGEVYDKLVRMGPAYREQTATSEAVQICIEGTEQLESYFGSYLPQLIYALIAPLTLFACLAPACLPAAVALLVCVPLIPASIVLVQKRAKRTMNSYWNSYTDLGEMFLESLQGLTTLKIFQADEARHAAMNEEAETFRRATMRLLKMQLSSITVMDLFAFGGAAVGIIATLLQFADGNIGFAAAFAVIFLSAEFFIPLRTLGSYFHTAVNGMAAAEKMYAILDAPEPKTGARTIDPANASIEMRSVSYTYDGKRTVLENVDFSAPSGSFIGVAGESGSGKSTLAGIISGANTRYTGTVSIGGIDLREASTASLRKTVVRTAHDSYLFKGTVRTNLLMARPQATDDELWQALDRARLGAFVREAGGLDAPVTAQGGNLSGGQRQRLAVARALLSKAPVYLFDEATSNIDAESENALIALARELSQESTVIMVSHRLSALTSADCIYMMENGHIAETGTHAELATAGGPYARMWAQQDQLEKIIKPQNSFAVYDQGEESARARRSDEHRTSGEKPGQTKTRHSAADGSPAAARPSGFSIMARLAILARPLAPVMALAVALGVAGFLAAIFLTVLAAEGLASLAASDGFAPGVIALVAVCGVIRGPLRYGEQLCNHYLAFRVLALMRDRMFAALRKLAPAKLEGKDKGDLVSLATADIELLEVFYAHTLSPAAIALITSLVMTAFIAAQSPVLGALALASYAAIGIAMPAAASRASGQSGRAVRDGIGEMNTFVLDSLRGLGETLQYGRTAERANELSAKAGELAHAERKLKSSTSLFIALTGAAVMTLDLTMLLAASHLVETGAITFSQAVLATAALMSSFGPVIAVAALGSTLQQTLASGARMLEILDEAPVTKEVNNGVDLGDLSDVLLNDVSFSYGREAVIDSVNLDIEHGETVQITGRSGSGKSTLLKLIMRFWDPDQGTVELSGVDARCANTASLRESIGFMTQDTHLFAGSIRDNLMIARPNATDAELATAIEKAALNDLIARLPQGLETPVGELGEALSGGERQRLGLARVFLHDAPLILLDEPTSNLDALSEAAVLGALANNRTGKTVVIVSHRPSAAALADRTYSVERRRAS